MPGVAALMLFIYGFTLIINASKDSAYTEATSSFVYALIGFAILAVSGSFVNALYLNINPSALVPGINSVTDFLVTVASSVFVLMITITGLRMISSGGDTGDFGKSRNLIITNSIGLALTLLAKAIVFAVAGNSPSILVDEMKGIALFLLTLTGTICVCAVVVAGAYLIISVDEGYKDRAKKTIIGTLFTLGVVLASYTLIATFI